MSNSGRVERGHSRDLLAQAGSPYGILQPMNLRTIRLRYLVALDIGLLAVGVPLSRSHDFHDIGVLFVYGALAAIVLAFVLSIKRSAETEGTQS